VICNDQEDEMKKSAMFLLTACMGLATVSAPALAQNGGHMMGNDQGQGTMGNGGHMMGNDQDQATMGNGGHMMGNDQGQGTMGNDHNMSGQDGQ
jgi:hypothetical protein